MIYRVPWSVRTASSSSFVYYYVIYHYALRSCEPRFAPFVLASLCECLPIGGGPDTIHHRNQQHKRLRLSFHSNSRRNERWISRGLVLGAPRALCRVNQNLFTQRAPRVGRGVLWNVKYLFRWLFHRWAGKYLFLGSVAKCTNWYYMLAMIFHFKFNVNCIIEIYIIVVLIPCICHKMNISVCARAWRAAPFG